MRFFDISYGRIPPHKIDRLEELNQTANNGLGCKAVETVIFWLNQTLTDSVEAFICFYNEHDKVRNYPELEAACFDIFDVKDFKECHLVMDEILEMRK